jgi:peptidoglycan/LPS O-acetylase OafA/YrhL
MSATTLYRSEWATRTRPAHEGGPGYRPDIAGLRAVAILLVVVYHAGLPAITGGYVGVDVFFVISGFLITSHLAAELTRTGRVAFGRFYGRRMVRLLPASVVVALATIAATWHWASPLYARGVSTDAVASLGYVMNLRLAVAGTHYLAASGPPSPLQHYWSLAVEEQFYLFWPVVLVLGSLVWLRRGRPSLAAASTVLGAIAAGSLALCVWQTGSNQPWAYFGLPARAWELALGGLVALSARRLSTVSGWWAAGLTWAGLAAVVGSALWYTDATPFPGIAAVLPVAGAAVLIAGGCAASRGGAVTVLGSRPMQELGRLSYSWYLWHWPVLTLAPYVLGYDPGVAVKLALVVAALVPASMSLTAVEDRIRYHRLFRVRARAGLVFGHRVRLDAPAHDGGRAGNGGRHRATAQLDRGAADHAGAAHADRDQQLHHRDAGQPGAPARRRVPRLSA